MFLIAGAESADFASGRSEVREMALHVEVSLCEIAHVGFNVPG